MTMDTDRHDLEREPRVRPAARGWRDELDPTSLVADRDAVRWGPVTAGLLVSLTLFVLLSLLALAIGLTAVDASNAGDQGGAIAGGGAIVGALIGIVSFFLGGFVAARTAAIVGRPSGALNGFLVWALGVVAILLLGALGLSSALGAAGDAIGQMGTPDVQAPDVDPSVAADAIRDSALVAFLSLAIPALAAAIGGALGARAEDDVTDVRR